MPRSDTCPWLRLEAIYRFQIFNKTVVNVVQCGKVERVPISFRLKHFTRRLIF